MTVHGTSLISFHLPTIPVISLRAAVGIRTRGLIIFSIRAATRRMVVIRTSAVTARREDQS
jgi:hypothetical protein